MDAPRICRHCGGPIVGRRPTALSCSPACKKAAKNAYLRDYMRAYRASPGYLERKREWTQQARARSDYRARELANKRAAYTPKPNRLPPMTGEQFRHYCKLRWGAAQMPRAAALSAILGAD